MAFYRFPRDGTNTLRRKKTETAEVTQRDKRFLRKKTTEWSKSTGSGLGFSVERTDSIPFGTASMMRSDLCVPIYVRVGTLQTNRFLH